MRIRISHETTFTYAPAARSIIQNLRLTPRSHDSQYVMGWRVNVDLDVGLKLSEDSLGNVVQTFSLQKPTERLVVTAVGEVETSDAVGLVRGAVETLPSQMFLRASPLAQVNGALRDFLDDSVGGVGDTLDRLHLIKSALHREMAFEAQSGAPPLAAHEAFALKRGGAADFAHAFIACARALEIPARFVSGYVAQGEESTRHGAFAWAEAETPGLGWLAFDAANDVCADERYVRVAVGFDTLTAAPFRAWRSGGEESVAAAVRIEQAQSSGQQ